MLRDEISRVKSMVEAASNTYRQLLQEGWEKFEIVRFHSRHLEYLKGQ